MDRNHWQGNARRFFLTTAAVTAALCLGCKHPADAQTSTTPPSIAASAAGTALPVPAESAATTAPAMMDYSDKGAHFQYPSTWKPKPDKDYELHLIPATGPANRDITFDIPDLPPHFPGMIRLGLIEHGYVDDLKKQHAGLRVDSSIDHPLPDGAAKARLVQSSWKQGDTTHADVGLLIMRNDRVYILSCNADAKDLPATRADFDKVIAALHWDGK